MKLSDTEKLDGMESGSDIYLRVAGGSQVKRVAGAISKSIREQKVPVVIAIGAGAVNQAVKAICVSQGMVAAEGYTLLVKLGFRDEIIKDRPCTAMSMRVLSV